MQAERINRRRNLERENVGGQPPSKTQSKSESKTEVREGNSSEAKGSRIKLR